MSGTIHCVAWLTDFATHVERVIWEVASVLSTVNPLFAVLIMVLARLEVSRRVRRHETVMWRRVQPSESLDVEWVRISLGKGRMLVVEPRCESPLPLLQSLLPPLLAHLDGMDVAFHLLHEGGEFDQSLLTNWLAIKDEYRVIQREGLQLEYSPDRLDDIIHEDLEGSYVEEDAGKHFTERTIMALNDVEDSITRHMKKLQHIQRVSDQLSSVFTVASWSLYAVARIFILALAFAGLRSQDKQLYVATWTRYLPSIG